MSLQPYSVVISLVLRCIEGAYILVNRHDTHIGYPGYSFIHAMGAVMVEKAN